MEVSRVGHLSGDDSSTCLAVLKRFQNDSKEKKGCYWPVRQVSRLEGQFLLASKYRIDPTPYLTGP